MTEFERLPENPDDPEQDIAAHLKANPYTVTEESSPAMFKLKARMATQSIFERMEEELRRQDSPGFSAILDGLLKAKDELVGGGSVAKEGNDE